MKKDRLFPSPHKGSPCLRATLSWTQGISYEERRTGCLRLKFSTVNGYDGDYGDMAYGDPRDDLAITAWVAASRGIYGWDVEFLEPYSVDAQKAEKMTRVFKAIERHLEKVYLASGQRPQSLGAYVVQVCSAIHVSIVCIENDAEREARTGAKWAVHNSDRAYMIDAWAARILDAEKKAAGIEDAA